MGIYTSIKGFNANVQYIPGFAVCAWAESSSNVCRASGRRVAAALSNGGRKFSVQLTGIKLHSSWGGIPYYDPETKLTFKFPLHKESCEVYNLDLDPMIRAKCLALTVMTPIVSIVRSICWIAQTIFLSTQAAFDYLGGNEEEVSCFEIKRKFLDSFRALKYGALMTGCALGGVAMPFTFRRYYGYYERILNRQPLLPRHTKFYLAYCFQRIGVLPESNEVDDIIVQELGKNLEFYRRNCRVNFHKFAEKPLMPNFSVKT